MKQRLAWNNGKLCRQPYQLISVSCHTLLTTGTPLFHAKRCFISLPLYRYVGVITVSEGGAKTTYSQSSEAIYSIAAGQQLFLFRFSVAVLRIDRFVRICWRGFLPVFCVKRESPDVTCNLHSCWESIVVSIHRGAAKRRLIPEIKSDRFIFSPRLCCFLPYRNCCSLFPVHQADPSIFYAIKASESWRIPQQSSRAVIKPTWLPMRITSRRSSRRGKPPWATAENTFERRYDVYSFEWLFCRSNKCWGFFQSAFRHWITGKCVSRFVDWLIDWLRDWGSEGSIDWLIDWVDEQKIVESFAKFGEHWRGFLHHLYFSCKRDFWLCLRAFGSSFYRFDWYLFYAFSAEGSSGFTAEPGRYHLYVSLACPWVCFLHVSPRSPSKNSL